MNSSSVHSAWLKCALILPLAVLLSFSVSAQVKQEKGSAEKRKVTIHITKEVDGKTTKIDTSFEAGEDFDFDSFAEKHNLDTPRPGKQKIEKNISIQLPDIDPENFHGIPDTIIINGDTVIVNTLLGMNLPDSLNLKDFDPGKFLDESLDNFSEHACPHMPEMPGCCPGHGRMPMPGMPPFGGFNFPGFENFLPFEDLDQLIIKHKRHGKKIVIKFRDNDEERESQCAENECRHSRSERAESMNPSVRKKVVVIDGNDQAIQKDVNTKVEKYKDGDKEIIIIKKSEENK